MFHCRNGFSLLGATNMINEVTPFCWLHGSTTHWLLFGSGRRILETHFPIPPKFQWVVGETQLSINVPGIGGELETMRLHDLIALGCLWLWQMAGLES